MRSRIGAGALAGLTAGIVFGAVMQRITTPSPMGEPMPMIMMMSRVLGSDRLVAGWAYLLVSSVVAGGIFGLVLGERAARIGGGLVWGALFGIALWLLGALILMPLLLGMPVFAPLTMAPMRAGTLASLGAHVLCGFVLGAVFAGLYHRSASPRVGSI